MSDFAVIVSDPPWSYANWSDAKNGAAASAMDTMAAADIAAIPVASWAARDCVLAMWATWPKLDEAIALVRAWGFEYVTAFPWIKTQPSALDVRAGIGFWTRSVSEVVLIGKRGAPKRRTAREETPLGLLVGDDRVFWAPRPARHSEKPEGLQDWLEDMFAGPHLELFARRERAEWTCWGGDLGFQLGPWGVRAGPLASRQGRLFAPSAPTAKPRPAAGSAP